MACLLYTSDAADEGLGVDLGGRRIIKKNNVQYLDPPYTRFEGKKEQQETFFIKDPHGNILELKTLKN